jgi:RHS repeat-associated protein
MKHGKVYVIAACCVLATVTAGVSVLRAQAPSPATRAPDRVMRALPIERSAMLADGRTFRLQGAAGRALVTDPGSPQRSISLPLPETRIGSALVSLPDGRLLIWGGIDASGVVLTDGLWFDPHTSIFSPAKIASLPRGAGQSMTLLTDGRVLVAGGWNADSSAPDLSVFRPASDTTEAVDAKGVSTNLVMDASLRSDGAVLLKDAGGDHGGSGSAAAAFLPASMTFDRGAHKDPADFVMSASLPASDATNVSASAPIALRFSGKVDPTTATSMSVTLIGPAGSVLADVNIAEEGRLAFIKPRGDLLTGTKYAVVMQGIKSADGRVLPFTTFGFETSAVVVEGDALSGNATASSGSSAKTSNQAGSDASGAHGTTTYATTGLDASGRALGSPAGCSALARPLVLCRPKSYLDNGAFYPGQDNAGETGNGQWRLNSKESISSNEVVAAVRSLRKAGHGKAAARIAAAPTGGDVGDVSGNVALIDGTPVAGASISYGEQRVRTDVAGHFLLKGLKTGHQTLFVDGSSVAVEGGKLGEFVAGVDIAASTETRLTYRLYMPKIIARDRIRLASPTLNDIVVTHPDLPGLEVRIPKGTVIRDHAGKVVTELSIVPMPVDRAPTPAAGNFPMYFSLQPGGATVQNVSADGEQGVSITYPNYSRAPAGAEAEFYVYRPDNGWTVYGTGVVTSDGRQVKPESGVRLTYLMSGSYGLSKDHPGDDNPTKNCGACSGDPVDLWSGTYFDDDQDIAIKDVIPLTLSRLWHDNAYHALDQRMFGGWRSNYDIYVHSPNADFSAPIVRLPNGNALKFSQIATRAGDTYTWQYKGDRSGWYGAVLETVSYNDRCGAIIECYLLTTVDGMEYQFTNSYPSNGAPSQLTFIRDRFHNQLTFTWNAGLLQQITSSSGRYIKLAYDQYNNIQSAEDNSGRMWKYAYHRKKLPNLVNAGGGGGSSGVGTGDDGEINYVYFLDGVTYPDGSVKQYTYQDNYETPNDQAAGTFDVPGTLLSVIDRNGKTILANTYENKTSRVVKQVRADGSSFAFAYVDTNGVHSRTDVTDPLGSVRSVEFDTNVGYPIAETRASGTPLAQKTSYSLTSAGQIIASVDAMGRKTAFEYDDFGNVVKVTRLAGTSEAVTSSYTWDPLYGLLLSQTDELGRLIKFSYAQGCLASRTDPAGNTTTIACNPSGQPTQITDPAGRVTKLEYDGFDLNKVTDPSERSVLLRSDSLGRRVAMTDSSGNLSMRSIDTNDRVITGVSATGDKVKYTYDAEGHLTDILRQNGSKTHYEYNALYMRTSRQDASGASEAWSYDALGHLATYTTRRGLVTAYSKPDALGRFTGYTDADGNSVTAGPYDAGNRLLAITDSVSGSVSRTFDNLDRLSSETVDGHTIAYTWNADGTRKSMTPDGQATETYAYDKAARIASLTQGSEMVKFTYDVSGRRTGMTLPNGIAASYAYEPAGNVTAMDYVAPGGVSVGNLTYTYDGSGRRSSVGGFLAPNDLDDATKQESQFDGNSRPTQFNGGTLSYDADGNITFDGTRSFTWNARGELIKVSIGGVAVTSYTYDALGRRKAVMSGAESTSYDYDGLNVVAERKGGEVKAILTGPGLDERYAVGKAGQRNYLLTDALGSVVAVTDASASILQRRSYTPYGLNPSTADAGSAFQYAGRESDASGLIYMRARYYAPNLASFISEDPARELGGLNGYAYADRNPISFTDPLGLAVGDKYSTPDQAATNAIDDVLGKSITENREYAGVVYKNWDGTYSYTEATPGTDRKSYPGSAPWLHHEEGIYHTHGAPTPGKDGENFSRPSAEGLGDIGLADELMEPNWLGTPNLAIKKYDPCTGKITTLRKAIP